MTRRKKIEVEFDAVDDGKVQKKGVADLEVAIVNANGAIVRIADEIAAFEDSIKVVVVAAGGRKTENEEYLVLLPG